MSFRYPDLVVGAYDSSAVFLFRARPIIDINTFVDDKNLRGIDPGKTGCLEDQSSSDACFGFAACFKISREVGHRHKLRYRIEAEPQKPMSRMYLRAASDVGAIGSTNQDKNSSVEGTKDIEADIDDHQCIQLVGYVGSTHLDHELAPHATPHTHPCTYDGRGAAPSVGVGVGGWVRGS